MKFGVDQCAHCGLQPVLPSQQYTPEGKRAYNDGPLFCSEQHFKSACRLYFKPGMMDLYDDANYQLSPHEQHLLRLAERGSEYRDDVHVTYTDASEVHDRLSRKQADLLKEAKTKRDAEEAYQWKLAYDSYAYAWFNAKLSAQQREWDKENAASDARVHKMIAEADRMVEEAQRRLEQSKPRPIPEHHRFEHTHVLGPSGSGKTTLIEELLLNDLKQANPPGYVIIDPKGEMIDRISRLAVFDPTSGRLRDRLVIIDPASEPPPALNMFSTGRDPHLTEAQRRRITNHLTATFAYIFSSANSRLTQRMGIPFSFIVRLVFRMGGDINTLMDLLDDRDPKTSPFEKAIQAFSQTDDAARRFFERDFYDAKTFGDSRGQIRTRVFEILKNPDLMAMFAAKRSKLDMNACLRQRKIVLVNTNMAQLGPDGSQFLGRYIIAMTLTAAFARVALPKAEWHPVHLVIDEFQDYADPEKTPELLRLAREYKLGVTIAHQTMHSAELGEGLRTAISTNTSVKYSASPEGVDASYMARDLRCDPSFLAQQQPDKDKKIVRFACYVRGMGLQHPMRIECTMGKITTEPQMSGDAHKRLLARNAAMLADTDEAPPQTPKQPQPPPQSPPSRAQPQQPSILKSIRDWINGPVRPPPRPTSQPSTPPPRPEPPPQPSTSPPTSAAPKKPATPKQDSEELKGPWDKS